MSGLEIRDAGPADHAAYVRLVAELGLDDAPASPERFVAEMVPASRFALRDGEPVGFTFWRTLADTTHLCHIVSAPETRRTGVGRQLLLDVLERARDRRSVSVTLNVAVQNVAAMTLYESAGFRVIHRSRALRLPWAVLGAPPALASEVRVLEPSDDERLERRFELAAGTFAAQRTLPDRVLRFLETPNGAAAATFDYEFPGCNPFRATDGAHAIALLHAFRPYARPEQTFINLGTEHQIELADALIAIGATLRFEMLRMRVNL